MVHDPSRRAKCAEEVSRHGLSLGGERRQWLFDFLTASPSVGDGGGAPSVVPAAGAVGMGEGGAATAPGGATTPAAEDLPSAQSSASSSSPMPPPSSSPEPNARPSPEALEAGGDLLFAEVRAAAPPGYFALRGKAAGREIAPAPGAGEEEATLDWVFQKAEADRVAGGTNTDLVLLEVVMVMLREQVRGGLGFGGEAGLVGVSFLSCDVFAVWAAVCLIFVCIQKDNQICCFFSCFLVLVCRRSQPFSLSCHVFHT